MKLKFIYPFISVFAIAACSGDPVRDDVTGGSFSKTQGEGNGVCTQTAEEITPFELKEKTHAPTDLRTLLDTGFLKTLSARITYETPSDVVGKETATLSLSAISRRGSDDVLVFSKACAKNFSPTLGAAEPINIIIPISNKESELLYNVYIIDYGPKYLTEEYDGRYMVLDSIASNDEDFVNPFGDEAPTSFEDIINNETSKVYITKEDGKIPDAFEDETVPKNYVITYFDEESRVRYHLSVLWTPPEEPADPKIDRSRL